MDANGKLPAYPVDCQGQQPHTAGLTKRESFAMAAMQAWRTAQPNLLADAMASYARLDADALLAELAKETP